MNTEDRIFAILGELFGAEEGELTADIDLFEAGLLDSFGILQLRVELEEQFGITLELEEIPRESFATPAALAALVEGAERAV